MKASVKLIIIDESNKFHYTCSDGGNICDCY